MSKEAKEIVEEILKVIVSKKKDKKIQMFDCYDILGDYKEILYKDDEVEVLYAPHYDYVETIGLTDIDYNYFFEKYGN